MSISQFTQTKPDYLHWKISKKEYMLSVFEHLPQITQASMSLKKYFWLLGTYLGT